MKRPVRSSLAFALFASALFADPAADKSADDEWTDLQTTIQQANSPTKAANLRASQQQALMAAADRCRDFAAKHPQHKRTKDSRCYEAILLERAWLNGDESQASRRVELARQMRHDKGVTPALRAELFALMDSVAIAKTPGLSREETLSAYAQSARDLVGEFPDLTVGYQALLAVARDSSESQASSIARELVGLPQTPPLARTAAQAMLDRAALLGQSIQSLTAALPEASLVFGEAKGRPLVLYTWVTNDMIGIDRAKAIAAKAPRGTKVVGVCLDAKIVAAKAAAASLALPGTQLYDKLGREAALARALGLTDSGMIYVADSAGTIRTVAGHNQADSVQLFAGL